MMNIKEVNTQPSLVTLQAYMWCRIILPDFQKGVSQPQDLFCCHILNDISLW